MKTKLRRGHVLLVTGGLALAACNLLLGNETVTVIPAEAGADGPSVPTEAGPSDGPTYVDDGRCEESLGGDWKACLGQAECLPGAPQRLLASTFTSIHLTPQGVMAHGDSKNFLVPDGTGAPGEPLARELTQTAPIDLTADHQYIYTIAHAPNNGVELRRYTGDGEDSFLDARNEAELQVLATPGIVPKIVAIGPGAALGYVPNPEGADGIRLGGGHVVARWDSSFKGIVSLGALNLGGYHYNIGYTYGAFGVARQIDAADGNSNPYADGNTISFVRSPTPVVSPLDFTAVAWQEAERSASSQTTYENVFIALNCSTTFVAATRWGSAPSIHNDRANGFDLNGVVMEPADAMAPGSIPAIYWGGIARWSSAADNTAYYLARSGIGLPNHPEGNSNGEIFVFSLAMELRARLPMTGAVRMLTVSDCYLYWLDGAGSLLRLFKPGANASCLRDR